ncbi:MAG: hypothetical protein ACLSAH_07170 [Bilophila wadsworthia]
MELDVIDGYQAGEIRSTKNLSGGEFHREPCPRPGFPNGQQDVVDSPSSTKGSARWMRIRWTPRWIRWPGCTGTASSSA